MTLLEPSFLARLERVQLLARRRLAGRFSGEHRSRRRGSSLEFADHRPYHPGDDYRRVDYLLLARLDVVVLKLFEAEEDLTLRLLVDTSASMRSGQKRLAALRLAGALGFVALGRGDAVVVHTLDGSVPARRFTGRAGAPALFAHLEALEAAGPTPLGTATRALLSRGGPMGITVVISDLLTPEWEHAIRHLPAAGELVVCHVLADEDRRPGHRGDLDLVDAETGARVAVSLSDEALRQYERIVDGWITEVSQRVVHAGGAYLPFGDRDDLERVLLARWREAGLLR